MLLEFVLRCLTFHPAIFDVFERLRSLLFRFNIFCSLSCTYVLDLAHYNFFALLHHTFLVFFKKDGPCRYGGYLQVSFSWHHFP